MQKTITRNKTLNDGDHYRSLGTLQSYSKTNLGIEGSTSHGSFIITFYNESIVRIRVCEEDFEEDFSYSVIAIPENPEFIVEEINGEIILSTGKLVVKIMKDPLRISFLNLQGSVICADDKAFGTSWLGTQVTTYKELQKGERFIGLGEKTGPLDKQGKGYENWNTDAFGYGVDTDPIYSSIPFYIGIHHNLQYGIFFDNSFKSHFNFGASNNRFSSFSADGGEMNYYFIYGETITDVIFQYTKLTGRIELPPIWSLGYQQCRYSYSSEEEVLRIADTFRMKDIPADAIVLDIHHMDKYKIFTWNPATFKNPEKLIAKLKQKGFHAVVICDPGIKISADYHAYKKGIENDIFLKYPDGALYEAQVWPGWCHFPDFSKAECRELWSQLLQHYTQAGVTGFWNDMNELATWGQMMPEMIQFDYEGKKASLRRMKNLYGLLMAGATQTAARKQLNGKRPFNLSRSGFAGIQRFAALWTGDNTSSEEHMLLGVRMVNNLGISGVPFTGYDVGGFTSDASTELFARWISIGAFSPFFRGHSIINSHSAEPWTFGERVLEISRNYIKLRYKLLPYIYSSFYEASINGLPVCRSLVINYPHEAKIFHQDFQNQYLFGQNIMVAPAPGNQELSRVFLPEGLWYDLFTDKVFNGTEEIIVESPLEKLPLFVKGSGILFLQSEIASTTQKPDDTLEVHIYNGTLESYFTYYEDDGDSYQYLENEFFRRMIRFNPENRSICFEKSEGELNSKFKTLRVFLHGMKNIDKINVDGKILELQVRDFQFIRPISCFDPIHSGKDYEITINNLPYFDLPNNGGKTEIHY